MMHAKGYCAVGYFAPDPRLPELADCPLFHGGPLPATMRFSVAGGVDTGRTLRGMALRMHGRDETFDMVLMSEPVFYAATPSSFVHYVEAHQPDPASGLPDPQRIAAHLRAYPEAARQAALLAAHAPPASHATTPYFSTHAFLFTSREGVTRAGRIVVEPQAGTHYLSAQEEASLPAAFLEREMDERLLQGPIRFMLHAQLPAAGDPLDDPSAPWQGAHRVPLGMLLISALAEENCDHMVFIPTLLPAGISVGDDPLLRMRALYAMRR